jgi:ADP-heptose:LPS heptosyltransferase
MEQAARHPSHVQLARVRRRRRFYRFLTGVYRLLFPSSATFPLQPSAVKRVLIVRDDRIGDLIVTTPLIDYLRHVAPHAEIDVVCSRVNAAVLAGDKRVAHTFVNEKTLMSRIRLVLALRKRAYDATFSVVPGNGVNEGWLVCLATPRHAARISIWRPKRYHGFFTKVARSPHSLALMPDQVLHVGVSSFPPSTRPITAAEWPMHMHITPESHAVVTDFLEWNAIRDFVAVNIWAAEAWRVWPPAHCGEVLRRLAERDANVRFILTPPPGRAPEAAAVKAAAHSDRVYVFPADARLADRAALIGRASLVMTVNTAVVPMASAASRPVVGLYSNKRADHNERYLPRGVPQRIAYARPDHAVRDIPADDVIAAYDALLADQRKTRSATS